MADHPNNRRLVAIITTRGMTSAEVALLCGAQKATVDAWRCGQRPMPDHRLELLEMKLDRADGLEAS